MSDLKAQLTARFLAINGEHLMTPADDWYVNQHFVPLDDLCAARSLPADVIRRHMLAQQLPLPGYIRSDGTEMVPDDLLELSEKAGGVDRLQEWFSSHWADPQEASAEWDAYVSGQNVCLRAVTPDSIQRKNHLVSAIRRVLAEQPKSARWPDDLHELVDELDQLEFPFAPYDRLRFGGSVTRDTAIDDVRARFPRRQD